MSCSPAFSRADFEICIQRGLVFCVGHGLGHTVLCWPISRHPLFGSDCPTLDSIYAKQSRLNDLAEVGGIAKVWRCKPCENTAWQLPVGWRPSASEPACALLLLGKYEYEWLRCPNHGGNKKEGFRSP